MLIVILGRGHTARITDEANDGTEDGNSKAKQKANNSKAHATNGNKRMAVM